MASDSRKTKPWDQRLAEHQARKSWEAANDPARFRNPSFREQIRSPYYWVSVLAGLAIAVILSVAQPGWPYALVAVLYLVALLASAAVRRDARAAASSRASTQKPDRADFVAHVEPTPAWASVRECPLKGSAAARSI